ncbi:MAG: rod-binding protein [Alphaproteobacteria bacterium]
MNDLLLSNAQVMMGQAGQTDMSAAVRNMREQASQSKSDDEAMMIAKEFEAVFVTEMMKPMFEGIDIANSDFGGGKGEEVFNKLLLQEYGKEIAERGGLGIAEEVKEMILELQGAQSDTSQSPQRNIGDVINAYTTHSTSQD